MSRTGISGSVDEEFTRFVDNFRVIHAGSLLHLLYEPEIETIVERMLNLLVEGGVFFGRTVGSAIPGKHSDGLRYLHSTESLLLLLKKTGFSEAEVRIMPRTGPAGEVSSENVMQMMFYATK